MSIATVVAALALLAIVAAASHRRSEHSPLVRMLGPTAAAQWVHASLVLRLPGRARLERDLRATEDPRSARYHDYVSARRFGALYGLPPSRIAAGERWLRSAGITVTSTYPQRTALEVRARSADMSRAFGVRLANYADASGHRWHAPIGSPRVPRALAPVVSAIAGLDTRPPEAYAVRPGGLQPRDAALAYDVAPLYQAGIRGQGETVAIFSEFDYPDGDYSAFASRFGITGPAPQRVAPANQGCQKAGLDSQGSTEADLDVEVVKSIAPEAQVLVYECNQPGQQGVLIGPAINQIVGEARANIVSVSYGLCESQTRGSDIQNDESAIDAAVRTGMTIFVASGDSGAYTCQRTDPSDQRLSVPWPAASPGVVGVGGTRLFLGTNGSYAKEQGWEDAISQSGGGGGVSTIEPRPSWQAALGVQNGSSTGNRQVPDVSADADFATGWAVYNTTASNGWGTAGGTSAAAPFWAAATALIHQYAGTQGVPRLGYLNPSLYALASSDQPYPPFHDITEGGNRYYQASTGWDYVSGLGSPDVWNLARDLVAYLKAHPPR